MSTSCTDLVRTPCCCWVLTLCLSRRRPEVMPFNVTLMACWDVRLVVRGPKELGSFVLRSRYLLGRDRVLSTPGDFPVMFPRNVMGATTATLGLRSLTAVLVWLRRTLLGLGVTMTSRLTLSLGWVSLRVRSLFIYVVSM